METTKGTRVQGKANPGDKVTYFDIANQDGTVWEVVADQTGDGDRYFIITEDGRAKWSDLRQYGWTFA